MHFLTKILKIFIGQSIWVAFFSPDYDGKTRFSFWLQILKKKLKTFFPLFVIAAICDVLIMSPQCVLASSCFSLLNT